MNKNQSYLKWIFWAAVGIIALIVFACMQR